MYEQELVAYLKDFHSENCLINIQTDVHHETALRLITSSDTLHDVFYVMNIGELNFRMLMWPTFLPDVTCYYDVSCNDHPTILSLFANGPYGFSCSSKDDITKVLTVGGKAEEILYSSREMKEEDLMFAKESNVNLVVFKDKQDLILIRNYHPKANLLMKITIDDVNKLINTIIPDLLSTVECLQLNLVGVSFDLGTKRADPRMYTRVVEILSQATMALNQNGINPTLVDLGTGIMTDTMEETRRRLSGKLSKRIKFIAQSGHFFVDSIYTLATRIMRTDEGIYHIGGGTWDIFRPTSSPTPKELEPPEEGPKDLRPYNIWGTKCGEEILVAVNVQLPELEANSWLIWRDMGANTQQVWPGTDHVCPHECWHPPIYCISTPESAKHSEGVKQRQARKQETEEG